MVLAIAGRPVTATGRRYAYVTSWSLLHDLKILARTVPVVLRRRGAN